MRLLKIFIAILLIITIAASLFLGATWLYLKESNGTFARAVSQTEKELRMDMIVTAQSWLGTAEGSAAHDALIQIYNSHKPLAQGYPVKLEDNWCAAFASAVAISENLTDIIPTECGCERQIGLWDAIGRWNEDDAYMPLPGDYIYYAWDEVKAMGDCTGWADHVGIVVGTAGPFIKVIEGNKDDMVTYRIILRNDHRIRGFGLPDYASKIA